MEAGEFPSPWAPTVLALDPVYQKARHLTAGGAIGREGPSPGGGNEPVLGNP